MKMFTHEWCATHVSFEYFITFLVLPIHDARLHASHTLHYLQALHNAVESSVEEMRSASKSMMDAALLSKNHLSSNRSPEKSNSSITSEVISLLEVSRSNGSLLAELSSIKSLLIAQSVAARGGGGGGRGGIAIVDTPHDASSSFNISDVLPSTPTPAIPVAQQRTDAVNAAIAFVEEKKHPCNAP